MTAIFGWIICEPAAAFSVSRISSQAGFLHVLFIDDAEGEISIDNQKIRLDNAKVIVIKPRCISSIDINRKAKGKIICFTEDFFSLRYSNSIVDQFAFLHDTSKVFVRLSVEEKNKWDVSA